MDFLKRIGLKGYLIVAILIIIISIFIAHPHWMGFAVNDNSNNSPNNVQCVENWICGDWSVCNGTQFRSCEDVNNCNTNLSFPNIEQNCSIPVDSSTYHQKLIWDGESNVSREWTFSNAQIVQNRVHTGSYAILLTNPTPPFSEEVMKIDSNDSNFALDLSNFNEISFYVRGDGTGESFYFKIVSLNESRESNKVNINDFISGGIIDRTYRLVKIPISALENKNYNLTDIGSFSFSSFNGGLLYMDDLYATDSSPISVNYLSLIGEKTIKVYLNKDCNLSLCLNSSNYAIYGLYGGNNKINPSNVNYTFDKVNSSYYLLLNFNGNLTNNLNYSLVINNLSDNYNNYLNKSLIYNFSLSNNNIII